MKKNIAEILKIYPSGMPLNSPVYDCLTFDYVDEEQARIYCKTDKRDTVWFTSYGCVNHSPNAKCVIFPYNATSWDNFGQTISLEDLKEHIKDMGYIDEVNQNDNPMNIQIGGTHYKDYNIQPIEFIHANKIPFCEANAIKYLCRWRNKNGVQDLEKAKHYIDLLIYIESKK